jgi:putative transposase
MILNEYGKIAYDQWIKLQERFPNFKLDVFQIMPNHVHGIIALNESVLAGFINVQKNANSQNGIIPQNDVGIISNETIIANEIICPIDTVGATATITANATVGATARIAPTVADIVGAYKSLVANACLDIYKSKNESMGKLWQRNYYEHIIRDEFSYQSISKYIINNPEKWEKDKFNNK